MQKLGWAMTLCLTFLTLKFGYLKIGRLSVTLRFVPVLSVSPSSASFVLQLVSPCYKSSITRYKSGDRKNPEQVWFPSIDVTGRCLIRDLK